MPTGSIDTSLKLQHIVSANFENKSEKTNNATPQTSSSTRSHQIDFSYHSIEVISIQLCQKQKMRTKCECVCRLEP